MSDIHTRRTYSIREVSTLTGLPASTLRYYEQIGVTPPAARGETSGHRHYTDDDLDRLTWAGCLAATGMPVADMRSYVAKGRLGPQSAAEQVALLRAQDERLEQEVAHIAVRRRYVALKIAYWQAVEAGRDDDVEALAAEAASLADRLRKG